MKELATRALTGAVYVTLTLGAAWSGVTTTFLLFLPVTVLAAMEYHRLHWNGNGPPAIWGISVSVATYAACALMVLLPDWPAAAAILAVVPFALLAIILLLSFHGTSAIQGLGALLAHVVYLGLPFATLPHLVSMGAWTFTGFMFLLWANDTGAYLVGRAIGRTKLMPAVSPNKTVEGLVGGGVAALLVAWGLGSANTGFATSTWLVCAVLVTITASIGDLLESALKRAAGVKDSGAVLPGHGGILDRFDGMLLAAPAVYLYLLLIS